MYKRQIQQDRPVTDLLTSDQTFVNGRLADHYGGVIADQYRVARGAWLQQGNVARTRVNDMHHVWFPVTGLQKAGRGGLFGMGVLLAKNSAGQRTSPVKRGFWAVHQLRGQHFPPPPADVARDGRASFNACEKCQQWQQALRRLAEMRPAKVEPDVVT